MVSQSLWIHGKPSSQTLACGTHRVPTQERGNQQVVGQSRVEAWKAKPFLANARRLRTPKCQSSQPFGLTGSTRGVTLRCRNILAKDRLSHGDHYVPGLGDSRLLLWFHRVCCRPTDCLP